MDEVYYRLYWSQLIGPCVLCLHDPHDTAPNPAQFLTEVRYLTEAAAMAALRNWQEAQSYPGLHRFDRNPNEPPGSGPEGD